jgi:hypothetical protein
MKHWQKSPRLATKQILVSLVNLSPYCWSMLEQEKKSQSRWEASAAALPRIRETGTPTCSSNFAQRALNISQLHIQKQVLLCLVSTSNCQYHNTRRHGWSEARGCKRWCPCLALRTSSRPSLREPSLILGLFFASNVQRRENKESGHTWASGSKVDIWKGRFAKEPGEVAAHFNRVPCCTSNNYNFLGPPGVHF